MKQSEGKTLVCSASTDDNWSLFVCLDDECPKGDCGIDETIYRVAEVIDSTRTFTSVRIFGKIPKNNAGTIKTIIFGAISAADAESRVERYVRNSNMVDHSCN